MPGPDHRLTRHLKIYSTSQVKGVRRLYNQWQLIEVRDTGRRYATAACPCGRTGLRYICFLRNRYTGAETYVGAQCARYFHASVPRLLQTMEIISIRGIKAKFKGRRKGSFLFQIPRRCELVKNMAFMRRYFRSLPYFGRRGYWQIYVRRSHGVGSGLRVNRWYVIKLDGATTLRYRSRCKLNFYLSSYHAM